jgi:hypothetical protein
MTSKAAGREIGGFLLRFSLKYLSNISGFPAKPTGIHFARP